jgi:hypothetical protein
MRLRALLLPAWIGLLVLIAPLSLLAEGPDPIWCRQNSFRIPYQVDPAEQPRLKEVQLYVAEDGTRGWKLFKTVGPTEKHFPFKTERDGSYSFLVRTIDTDGKAFPPAIEGAPAGLRVIVDTRMPTAILRSRNASPRAEGEQVGVDWEVRDANLDLSTFQLEYRAQGTGEWQSLSVEPRAQGQRTWSPSIRGPLEVRLRVKDKADNQGTAYAFLNATGDVQRESQLPRAGANIESRPARSINPPGVNARVVNTTDINLNYSIEDQGPSGVSSVELWMTSEGKGWQRYGEDADKTSPFAVKVPGEGVYGFTLLVKSGVGIGDQPPKAGDQPQLWIEVDQTKPLVQLQSADVGRGSDSGNVTITWNANDKNLTATPISLRYAESVEGPWLPIATDLDNSGRYIWRVPPATPFKFFVRVEAVDRGGNLARADSAKPVLVDTAQPKGRLLGVEPGGGR